MINIREEIVLSATAKGTAIILQRVAGKLVGLPLRSRSDERKLNPGRRRKINIVDSRLRDVNEVDRTTRNVSTITGKDMEIGLTAGCSTNRLTGDSHLPRQFL